MNLNYIKRLLIKEYPVLAKYLRVNYGLLPDVESEKDYLMGANSPLNWKVLKEDSNWEPEANKMINEEQRGRRVETMGCTGYALNNVEEMIEINKYGKAINRSDRFLNKMSGTGRNGNNMSRVLETRRKLGFLEEKDWDWDRDSFTWNEYYAEIPQPLKDKALVNNKKYVFGYDGVWATKSMLIEALKYSPLYVGLYAWYKKGMLYYSVANPNHASTIISRNKFLCYDSYNPYIKHLDEGFKVYYVKRIYLEKAGIDYNVDEIIKLKKRGFKYIMRTDKYNGGNGEVYKLTDDNQIVELTPQEKLEIGMKELANKKDLTGVSESLYFNLIY